MKYISLLLSNIILLLSSVFYVSASVGYGAPCLVRAEIFAIDNSTADVRIVKSIKPIEHDYFKWSKKDCASAYPKGRVIEGAFLKIPQDQLATLKTVQPNQQAKIVISWEGGVLYPEQIFDKEIISSLEIDDGNERTGLSGFMTILSNNPVPVALILFVGLGGLILMIGRRRKSHL